MRSSQTADDTRTNIELCFPNLSHKERDALVHTSLTHMVLLFFELAQLRYWEKSRLLGELNVTGEDALQNALASGEGVLLLVPHIGNWELMSAFLGEHYTVAALYDPPKKKSFEAEILSARQRFAGKMFPIGVGGMRNVMKELRSGGLIAILPDQVPARSSGTYADFFSHPALTMTLPHQLISKTSPRVILGSVLRGEIGGYDMSFEPLDLTAALASDDSAGETAKLLNLAIEEVVLRAPEQYQWEYRRFKRPPQQGQKDVYRRQ